LTVVPSFDTHSFPHTFAGFSATLADEAGAPDCGTTPPRAASTFATAARASWSSSFV
jgi:hypothetical protein